MQHNNAAASPRSALFLTRRATQLKKIHPRQLHVDNTASILQRHTLIMQRYDAYDTAKLDEQPSAPAACVARAVHRVATRAAAGLLCVTRARHRAVV